MLGVLAGFFAIWSVVGVGWFLAHRRIPKADSQRLPSELGFFVGNPALMVTMMAKADLRRVFAMNLAVTVAATVTTGVLYLVIARWVLRPRPGMGHTTIGTFAACYVNASNMGLPIASYVLHDVTWVAPLLLVQVGIFQPLGLAFLDVDAARGSGAPTPWKRNVTMPLRNPMTLGVLAGLALNLLHVTIPGALLQPLTMLGALAVPTMLLSFGVSLRLGELPGRREGSGEVWLVSLLKPLVQPLIALAGARLVGLDPVATRAVLVLAGLPMAQNVFNHAVRYDREVPLARDVVFITSITAIGTVTLFATLV